MTTFCFSRILLSFRAALALFSFLLVGCVHYAPVTEPGDRFTGLEERTKKSELVRVFTIHGMRTNEAGYSTDLVDRLAGKMNFKSVAASPPPEHHPIQSNDKDTLASLQIYHLAEKNGGTKRMVVYEYLWSPITTPAKKANLGYDEAIPRAKFNKDLKLKIVNDGLSDAVLYVTDYDDSVLNRAAVVALGEFIARKYDANTEVAGNEEVAFFSSSLGSIMLFDAIESYAYNYAVKLNRIPEHAIQPEPSNRRILTAELRTLALNYDPNAELMAQTISRTGLLVMFANQLPLLKLSDPEWKRTIAENLGLLKGRENGLLDIVVMSDPNDLLSYRVETEKINEVQFHNVAPHNAWDFFGLFENPVPAHSGYYNNDQMMKIIIDGLK